MINLKDKIKSLTAANFKEWVAIRRHLHANPELSFEEFNTSDYIASKLSEFGISFEQGMVKTGIVAIIKGRNPEKKTIALRADIDALPILEKNEVSYKSKNDGVMHACGHDVHSTCVLGTAKLLNELKEEFEGTVKLIFQPGEEQLPGGASLMIKEGVLKNPDAESIIGQHVFPELEAGKVGFKPGMYMASADEIRLTIKGKGGHAALPQQLIDPVLITSHIIVALQQLISRNSSPTVPSVLSFGRVMADGVTNIIPNEVHVEGTFRTMDEDWRMDAHAKIQQLVTSMAEGMGGEAIVDIQKGYPFLINDTEMTLRTQENAREFLGEENVVDLSLRMTSEDFSYYSHELPATFYRLGISNLSEGINSNLHTNTFDIDESALETGIGLMTWLALNELKLP